MSDGVLWLSLRAGAAFVGGVLSGPYPWGAAAVFFVFAPFALAVFRHFYYKGG